MRSIASTGAAAVMMAASLATVAQPPAMKQQGEIRWICGGVGADERREIARAGSHANLEILFVSAKRGAYLAAAKLDVYRGAAAKPLLSVETGGPMCFLEVPAGAYRVQARLRDFQRGRVVHIRGDNARAQRVVFTFPDEPWDGIRASEEEKRQAREP